MTTAAREPGSLGRQTVLVTGAAGKTGQAVVRACLAGGLGVRAFVCVEWLLGRRATSFDGFLEQLRTHGDAGRTS